MAQSITDACNSALQLLGQAKITALTDNSREARSCLQAWDSNRRDELRRHLWNFAIVRVVLAPDSTPPAFDYSYAFTLPADCIRVIRPNDASLDWQVEGRKILTNASSSPFYSSAIQGLPQVVTTPTTSVSLRLRYVSDIEDVTQWDPSFYQTIPISLAMDMCEELTNSTAKMNGLQQMYKEAIAAAKATDAFENAPSDPPDDYWWTVRF